VRSGKEEEGGGGGEREPTNDRGEERGEREVRKRSGVVGFILYLRRRETGTTPARPIWRGAWEELLLSAPRQ